MVREDWRLGTRRYFDSRRGFRKELLDATCSCLSIVRFDTGPKRSMQRLRRAEAERERHERSEEGAVHGSLGVFYVGCTCGGQKK